ncbi:hypothetical protein BASA60_000290 [Batrachochytrium salamandrivorans]|nr:hypothetical protein BASA60_000290 [Batrachochytrium salamandrivorans]
MNSLNTPSTTAATTTTTTTTTAVHFSRRARTSRNVGKVPSDIIGETEHTQTQISPKVSRKQIISNPKASTTTESSIKQVHFSRRAPTKRATKPREVNISITKPKTRTSLPLSQIPRPIAASTTQYEHQPSSKVSPSSRIPISPSNGEGKTPGRPENNQPNAFKKTFPIHGSVGSVLTGDEESKCIDLSHEISTVTDATAGVVSSGGAVSTAYGSNTMTVAGVVLSDEVSRVYSNSLMQLDNTSFPEIVVGMGCTYKSVEITRGKISTNSISTTTMAAAAIKSRRAVRVNSSNPTRQNGSSSPEVAVKGMCVGKKIVADSRVRVRKPRGGKVMAAAAGIHSDEPTTRLDDTISDSLLLVSREHYFEQFDISRVDDDRGKACKDVQAYDGGHLLDTLTSAVDYVERHQGNSIYEQDAAHMGPEVVCRGDLRQMDSSHSDCYRQTVYRSNLDILAASAISDAVDCLKCPTALLQLCGIALDDGPLRPAWPLQGANTEHSSTSVHLTRNITPAPAPSAAMVIAAPAATAKQGSTAAKSKKAASTKRGGSLTAPIFNSIIGSEKEDAFLLKRKRTRKDGGIPTQRKKACKVATQPVVEELSGPKERLEAREEENKDIGSTSAVRRPYRTSKKPANPLATAGDTMPTEDELKAMTYIASSLRMVPHSSEVFEIHSTNLTCLSGSNSSTMKCTEKIKDETVDLLSSPEWSGQRNSGRRRCNARSDLGLALAAAPPSSSSLPARLKNKRAATELTDLDTAAPKRLCKL